MSTYEQHLIETIRVMIRELEDPLSESSPQDMATFARNMLEIVAIDPQIKEDDHER